MYQQRQMFGGMPPVVKNILIINGLAFFAMYLMQKGITIPGIGYTKIDLNNLLGLYTPGSKHFYFFQYITYMFMHGNLTHIFFNMFAVFMFGRVLERMWGPQKFLFYYLVTGIGAGLINVLISFVRVKMITAQLPPEVVSEIYTNGQSLINSGLVLKHNAFNGLGDMGNTLNHLVNIPMVGASGSVFGLLLAFGMLFPEERIYLYMVVPIKAKWFVIGYGAMELYSTIFTQPGDNVAHLAHLGGMLFGFFLIRHWRKNQF